ncbi:MAG: hypothetical protein KF730_10900 [Sphingomonas sp.]|uniref:hypothetical protein n=1 Tax=Sphingomonas sp. TaxID=28214 RepID=UPI0025DDCC27|nr:hypothetical protein [Sphingomonas sp.]MBX3565070.1 hypothetical protein [Sphingomonas sp.]
MRLIDRIAFTGAAVTGLALLAFGIWVFAISLVPAPVTMVSGGVLLVLTAIAWRQHRAALTDGSSEK